MMRKGFTIVELLIVVVVIAILAAITIVAYNGIQNRAQDSALASQVASAAKKVEIAKVEQGGVYPVDTSGLQLPTDGNVEYTYYTSTDRASYCLAAKKGDSVSSIATGGVPLVGGCASTSPGALGWWPLNGDGAEGSGNGRALTMIAGMSAGVGQDGAPAHSVSFTGAAQPTIPEIPLTGLSFSVSGWMNVATFNHSGSYAQAPMLGARSSAGGSFTAMHFGFRAADSTSSPRTYMDYFASGQAAGTLVNTNTWYHVAYTYDVSSNVRRFYINGAPDGSYTAGAPYRGIIDTIGYSCCMTGGIQGRLDDIRVYGRTLTAAEVADIYNSGAL